MKKLIVALLMLLVGAAAGNAYAEADEWRYGIGTGFYAVNLTGDMGYKLPNAPFWPEVSGTLSWGQISNLIDTAFGFGGYATKGDWTILYTYSQMKLTGDQSGSLPGGGNVHASLSFTAKNAEVDGVYAFAKTGNNYWGALGGVRYYNQKIAPSLSGAISGGYNISASWADLVLGVTHKMPFTETMAWHNRFDLAGGGTKGTYHFNTGVGWRFAKDWSSDFYANYIKYNYEKGTRGSSNDWYLYHVAEYGVGASVMYNW